MYARVVVRCTARTSFDSRSIAAHRYHPVVPIRTCVSSTAKGPRSSRSGGGNRSLHRRYHRRTASCDRRLRRTADVLRNDNPPW